MAGEAAAGCGGELTDVDELAGVGVPLDLHLCVFVVVANVCMCGERVDRSSIAHSRSSESLSIHCLAALAYRSRPRPRPFPAQHKFPQSTQTHLHDSTTAVDSPRGGVEGLWTVWFVCQWHQGGGAHELAT